MRSEIRVWEDLPAGGFSRQVSRPAVRLRSTTETARADIWPRWGSGFPAQVQVVSWARGSGRARRGSRPLGRVFVVGPCARTRNSDGPGYMYSKDYEMFYYFQKQILMIFVQFKSPSKFEPTG